MPSNCDEKSTKGRSYPPSNDGKDNNSTESDQNVDESSKRIQGIHIETQSEKERTEDETNTSESDESSSTKGDASEDRSRVKSKKLKKDKSKLRKGKWTVEEEEYTARIIQHFSTGVLTLPEGSTLRSYLADRLNCDPMRITKKFTGACCLGRRVYHLTDRPRASPAQIEMAKAELGHLEKRFRMRLEQEQSGIPLARRQELLLSQRQGVPNTLFPLQSPAPSASGLLQRWSQPYSDLSLNNQVSVSLNRAQGIPLHSNLSTHSYFSQLQQNPNRWLIPNSNGEALLQNATASDATRIFTDLVTSLALAQVSNSLMPSLAQTPSTVEQQQQRKINEEHQKQLRNAYEQQKREEERRHQLRLQISKSMSTSRSGGESQSNDSKQAVAASTPSLEISPAEQLKRSYKAHLESLRNITSQEEEKTKAASSNDTASTRDGESGDARSIDAEEKPADDEEAGSILLGFVKSLRQSYEDAMESKKVVAKSTLQSQHMPSKKRSMDTNVSQDEKLENTQTQSSRYQTAGPNGVRPASVTDTSTLSRSETSSGTSSQPNESSSSTEDSDSKSDDKSDPSSSEESEKEDVMKQRTRGPPRKRMKQDNMVKEFTAKNLAEHSKRMSEKFSPDKRKPF